MQHVAFRFHVSRLAPVVMPKCRWQGSQRDDFRDLLKKKSSRAEEQSGTKQNTGTKENTSGPKWRGGSTNGSVRRLRVPTRESGNRWAEWEELAKSLRSKASRKQETGVQLTAARMRAVDGWKTGRMWLHTEGAANSIKLHPLVTH